MTSDSNYQLRPYDPTRESDRESLDEICAKVYGGGDYLPKMAASYVADPSCSFLALTNNNSGEEEKRQPAITAQDDNILAVANYKRLPAQNSAWIEAVRTHPDHRNKGLASKLLHSLVDLSKEEDNLDKDKQLPTNVLTCTVQSNVGMIRALEKVGFVKRSTIVALSFSALKDLPGWNPNEPDFQPQPLLDALNLNHLVSPAAKAIPSTSWSTISCEQQLVELLQNLKDNKAGTCGYMPGLYEYIVPGPNRADLKQSLERGLVFRLDLSANTNDKEASNCAREAKSSGGGANDESRLIGQAILVFTQDERISSLKSNWVCSIVAHTQIGFEAAVWHAHSSEVARKMRNFQSGDDDLLQGDENEELNALPFCLVFDDAVPLKAGSLAHALPRVTDECVVFSYQRQE